jgi:dimethylargininase
VRLALTRPVSPSMARCELTHVARAPIDLALAAEQHAEYERVLAACGYAVEHVAAAPELPDAVFVEDTVVVVDELAVLARPGAESRRPEVAGVADALAPFRRLAHIEAPGTLDGGDVLRLDRDLYVGVSRRTNTSGMAQLADALAPFGYRVTGVEVHGCLHLKSAVTRVGPDLLLVNRAWIDTAAFAGWRTVDVDEAEPFAANALLAGGAVIYSAAFPRTRARLDAAGVGVVPVDVSEMAKAEGGVTCCSVLLG